MNDLFKFIERSNKKAFSITGRDGKEYRKRLLSGSREIESNLSQLLPSTYKSSVGSTNYGLVLRAYSIELAKIKIALEDVQMDQYLSTSRADLLYQNFAYLMSIGSQTGLSAFSSEEFRRFLLSLIEIFFGGSTPDNVLNGLKLFLDSQDVFLYENFKYSAYDISDQFGFTVDVVMTDELIASFRDINVKLDLLLQLIKPAHTLYYLRFRFSEDADIINTVTDDEMSFNSLIENYDDIRKNFKGIEGRDGVGVNRVSEQVETFTHYTGNTIILQYPIFKDETLPVFGESSDVEVTVNGDSVDVDSIDASTGTITLVDPLSYDDDIIITYFTWFHVTVPLVIGESGHCIGDSYPVTYVLIESPEIQPVTTSWSYTGFQRDYTSAVGDPSTLLVNEPTAAISHPDTRRIYGHKHVIGWQESTSGSITLYKGTPIHELDSDSEPEVVYNSENESWDVVTPGGRFTYFEYTSEDTDGVDDVLKPANEVSESITFSGSHDVYTMPPVFGSAFIAGRSLLAGRDGLGSREVMISGSVRVSEESDDYDAMDSILDDMRSLLMSVADTYSSVFDTGSFILTGDPDRLLGDPSFVLTSSLLQSHMSDEDLILYTLDGDDYRILPYESRIVSYP